MHIARIKLTNWGPFRGEHVLELGPGVFALTAGNGLGKSVCLLSIPFAFFGHLPKGVTAEQMVSEGEQDMAVELTMSDGDVVERGWNGSKGKKGGYAGMTGVEGANIADVDRHVREVLGVSAQELLATSFLTQGDVGELVSANQGDRRDLLASWVVPQVWADLKGNVERARKDAERALSPLRARLAEYGEPADRGAIRAELDALRMQRKELGDVAVEVPRLEDEQREALDARDTLEEADRADADVAGLVEPDVIGLEGAEAEREELRAKAAEMGSRLRELEKLAAGKFGGECPLDGMGCPREAEINDRCDENRSRAEKLGKAHDLVLEGHDKVTDDVRKMRRERDDFRDKKSKILGGAAKIRTGGCPWTKIIEAEAAGDAHERSTKIAEVEREIGRVEAKLKTCEAAIVARKKLDVRVVEVERRLSGLRWLEHAAGRRGIPARIVEGAVGDVVRDGNNVLGAAGSPLRFEMRTKRELKKAARFCGCGYEFGREKKCPSCKAKRGRETEDDLTPMVRNGDGPPRKWKSSGQGMMLSLSLRIGVASWRRRKNGTRLSLLALDEFEGPLDAENAEAAHDLARRAATQLGFDQVILVSHRPASALSGNRVIRIESDGAWSTIRVD